MNKLAAAQKLEEYIFKRQKYQSDPAGFDDWEFSAIIFRTKEGDCEDGSNFFIACMTLLGFGEDVVGIANKVNIPKAGFKGRHAYSKVEIDGEWIVFDWNFPNSYRNGNEEYDIVDSLLNYMWNAYGTFRTVEGGTI